MEKILIGNKEYVGKQNTDNYIDIDLMRTIETIKRDSIDNVFDFQQQYTLERNDSMKFCVYGMIESRFGHSDNLAINITVGNTESSGATVDLLYLPNKWSGGTTGYSTTILTYPLNGNSNSSKFALGKNLYGAARGSYFVLFELDKEVILKEKKNKSVYFEIYEPIKELFGKFSVPIIFFDADGEMVEFGTENAEINNDNEIVEFSNDFPFFYDRHWVKQNIQLRGPATAFFVNESSYISESVPSINIDVSLNEASKYGLERARIVIDFGIDANGNRLTTADFGTDFTFIEPILNWSPGEQIKSFSVSLLNDLIVENAIETIVFRIIPISNINLNPSQQYKHTLFIESEDVPVVANFTNPTFYITEPNPNITTVSGYTIGIQLSSPTTIDNQKIGVQIIPNSGNAILGTDYYIDSTNKSATEILINTPLSASSVSFNFFVIGNRTYDVEKTVKLQLFQKSDNIAIGNTVSQTTITIKDGMVYKYVQYIIPFDLTKGKGAFKTIYNGTSIISSSIAKLELAQPDPGKPFQQKDLRLTHLFNCNLHIKNLGYPMVWNNQIVNNNQSFIIPLNFSGQTSDIVIDLPTNMAPEFSKHSFRLSKYEFSFKDFSSFYPFNLPSNWIAQVNQANNFNITVRIDSFTGGTSGQTKRYLISELENVMSQYDIQNDSCLLSATSLNQNVLFNGAIFLPTTFFSSNSGTFSKSKLFFNDKKVLNRCEFTGLTLPVGMDYLPNPPFNERYVRLDLGGVFLQSAYLSSQSNSNMRLGATTVLTTNPHEHFTTWTATHVDTKTNARLRIHNKGDRDVTVLSKNININSYTDYDFNDIDFSNMSIILPTNESYSASTNSFKYTNYIIEFLDFRIYNNNTFSNQTVSKALPVFKQIGGSLLSMPTYYIQTKYNKVKIGVLLFGNVNCSVNPATAQQLGLRKVKVNDIILFANTGTQEITTEYKSSSISPTCQAATIKYEII